MKLMRNIFAAGLLLGALALPVLAQADPCKVEISGNDMMQYDKKQLSVPATCQQITVTLHHAGKQQREVMGHDWVLVRTPDMEAVVQAGLQAGLANDYVQPGDKRVLAHTKVVGGGESASVTFPASILKKGGDYTYVCTFPGHSVMMHGKFVFG